DSAQVRPDSWPPSAAAWLSLDPSGYTAPDPYPSTTAPPWARGWGRDGTTRDARLQDRFHIERRQGGLSQLGIGEYPALLVQLGAMSQKRLLEVHLEVGMRLQAVIVPGNRIREVSLPGFHRGHVRGGVGVPRI